jgi:hypothetical protein
MKKYHLTILRNGSYLTTYVQAPSIAIFLLNEAEFNLNTHILYSRELSDEEWESLHEE